MPDRYHYLSLLGLKSGAQTDAIKLAYHDLVKVWHPDRFAHDPALAAKAQEKLKEINEAYAFLMKAPEEGRSQTRAESFYQHHHRPPHPSTRFRKPGSVWERQGFVFLFALLLSVILLKIAFPIFRSAFHNSSSGKTVRDIA